MTGDPTDDRGSSLPWMLRGMTGIFSAPALILTFSMVGFAGLAREAGLSWAEASFMTITVWALPAQIILVGAVAAAVSLPVAAFAVALSSLRLMPMLVSWAPFMRGPRTRPATLYALSHFVAITGWVFTMERLSDVPPERRTAFFAGFAIPLAILNTLIVALTFNLMDQLPALVAGALAFLTPVYFLASVFGSARDVAGRLALLFGLLLLPPAQWLTPGYELMSAGVAGGVPAFLIGRWVDARRGAR